MKRVGLGILFLAFISSCGSGRVTKEDVQEQEQEALQEVEEAKEASVELAEMKQQFSEDFKKAKIESLQKQIKEIDSDIEKLSAVETSEAQSGTKGLVSDLKNRREKLKGKMADVERMDRENWEQTMESINKEIASIKNLIKEITANLDQREAVKEK